MTGILPTIVTLLILIPGLLVGSNSPKDSSTEIKRILPIGFFGLWGEGLVEPYVWYPKGTSARLLCRISRLSQILETFPEAKVKWVKDDLLMDLDNNDSKRVFITTEGHLNITKLVRRRGRSTPENDEGVYRCMLTIKKEIEYMVSAPPITLQLAEFNRQVSVSTTNTSVINGTSLRLTCKAPSQPLAIFHWQKDKVDLPHDVRISQPTSGVLQITKVEDADGGIYRCVAYNEELNKTKYSEDVSVTVTSPPELPSSSASPYIPPSFLYPTSNMTMKLIDGWGDTLECSAYGLPFPQVIWKRKGVLAKEDDPWEVFVDDEDRRKYLSNGNLVFDIASVEDAGRYSCTASSQDPVTGKVNSVSQEFKVSVVVKPVIAHAPRNITSLMAKTVRLNCSLEDPARGLLPPGISLPFYFPAPHIVWYKNGVPIQLDARTEVREDNQLVFLNSGTSDTAIYQCLATNEAGYATAWSYLLVNSSQDHPLPPKNLQVVLLSSTSALFTWGAVNHPRNPVLGYSIHLIDHSKDLPKPHEYQFVSQINSHIYESLKPNTNYSFYIRAYNTMASDPSETVNFTTREAVPVAAPEFTLQVLSPSSLLVTWSPLPADKARGTVDGYKIQWQRRKKDYYNLNEVGPYSFQQELQGLHPGKTYKVRVLARTKAGYNEGTDWPWKSITMPDVVDFENSVTPLAPLMHVKMTGGEPSENGEGGGGGPLALEITWQRHKNDLAPLTGYSLSFKKGEDPWSDPVILPADANSYFISNIDSNWYKIKLSGINDEGEGAATVDMFHTEKGHTKEVSEPPSGEPEGMPTIKNVQLVPERQTVVQLSWETSHVENKPVAFYHVKQEKFQNNAEPIVLYHKSLNNSITIDNLVPFITYQFAVRAHISEDEHGPYSQAIQTSTVRNTLSAPKKMRLERKDASTLKLQWDMAAGAPTKYQIAYTKNKTLPIPEWRHMDVNGNALSSTIGGLVSDTEYWFRVRGCRNDACGSYSDSYSTSLSSIQLDEPNSNSDADADSPKVYLIVGVAVAVIVLFLVIIAAVCMFRNRFSNPRPILASNANGSVGNHGDGIRGHHQGGRNGVTDVNGREGDYIPMLNRIHTDIPTTPLDTKGGYNNSRVNGYTNPKCNGVIRGKELHCGTNPHSKRDDSEERECLFPCSRDGDIMSRAIGADDSTGEEEHVNSLARPRNASSPPLTQTTYNDKEGVSCP